MIMPSRFLRGRREYGKPAQVLTYHGSQFYANERKNTKRGTATFENKLLELGIKHTMARIRHPQTNCHACPLKTAERLLQKHTCTSRRQKT